jgi:RsiW-degrading membrane proteinase PrsW (M82 family)
MRALLRVLGLLAALAFAWALAGCAPALAGSNDVELVYEPDDEGARAADGGVIDLRPLVLRRLAAAQVGADVSQEGPRVRVVVDEALAPAVDEVVRWSGTLLLYATDPSAGFVPRDASGLEQVTAPAGAEPERWWEGSRDGVQRAVEGATVDHGHKVLAEPVPVAGSRERPRWRTRVVHARPVAEIDAGFFASWGEGAALRFRAQARSEAELVLQQARRRALEPGARPEVVARGRTSMGPPLVEGDAIVLRFGDGPHAYARAAQERKLLATPRLPALRRLGAVGLPPDRALGTACVIVPVALSFAWLVFMRRFDRAHPEPMWLVGVTFALGAAAAFPAALLEVGLAHISPWLDPSLASLGGRLVALPLAFLVFTLVVGLVEEGAKLAAALFAARRREFDEPVDGIVYGVVSSLGFAAAENVRYFAMSRLSAPAVIARCFMAVPAHMFFGALWGYALGAQLVTRSRGRVALALLGAAAAHGLFDALLATDGTAGFALLLNLLLASAFVALVRRALRHGVLCPEARAVPAAERRLYRVGRPALFVASAVAVHVLALGIFVLGVWYQYARHRPSLLFVGGSSVMVALLAIAALGVSNALPLDVAIDSFGVTFAGAARAWSRIRSFAASRNRIELDCEAGPLVLGPGEEAVVLAIAADLGENLGRGASERVATLAAVSGPPR